MSRSVEGDIISQDYLEEVRPLPESKWNVLSYQCKVGIIVISHVAKVHVIRVCGWFDTLRISDLLSYFRQNTLNDNYGVCISSDGGQ
jgi:hypothetical protein